MDSLLKGCPQRIKATLKQLRRIHFCSILTIPNERTAKFTFQ